MDHIKVLKRAFAITWRYRALWIFGIILALTTASGGGSNSGTSYQGGGNGGGNQAWPQPEWHIHTPQISPQVVGALIAIGAALVCLIVILIVAGAIAQYVARTALIRMVDDHEETGEKRSVRQGFRLGWSRSAWRLFLIDLLIGLPTAGVFILLFLLPVGLGLLSGLVVMRVSQVVGVIGIVAAVGIFFLVILLAIVVGTVLRLLQEFFWRACALEGLGVVESIRQGYGIVRRHLKDTALMWLLMLGLGLAWVVVMIAVALLLFVAGAVVGGLPALLTGGLASLVAGPGGWIAGAVVGGIIFLLVLILPMLFLSGLAETFASSTWTLTYRELRALEGLTNGQTSEVS